MAQLMRISEEEAVKLMSNGCECYVLLSHDLENDISLGRKRVDKKKGKILIMDSKTLVLNKDNEEDDSFSILSMYSKFQKDIFKIQPTGIKHDMILFPNIPNNRKNKRSSFR